MVVIRYVVFIILFLGPLFSLFADVRAENTTTPKRPWFSLAPKAGYVFFQDGSLLGLSIDDRHGGQVAADMLFGREGFVFQLQPLYAYETAQGDFGDLQSIGTALGLNWRWVLGEIEPSVGFGIRGTFVFGDQVDLGTELYGRVPVSLSWYMAPILALDVEVALMYGATGLKGGRLQSLIMTSGLGTEISVGLRFP